MSQFLLGHPELLYSCGSSEGDPTPISERGGWAGDPGTSLSLLPPPLPTAGSGRAPTLGWDWRIYEVL